MDNATIHTIEHGEASDLPKVQWFWRRVFVFALTAVLCAIVWRLTERVTDIPMLHDVARISLGIIALLVFAYVVGATATDCVSLVSALRTTRRETLTTPGAAPPSTDPAAPGVPDAPTWGQGS